MVMIKVTEVYKGFDITPHSINNSFGMRCSTEFPSEPFIILLTEQMISSTSSLLFIQFSYMNSMKRLFASLFLRLVQITAVLVSQFSVTAAVIE